MEKFNPHSDNKKNTDKHKEMLGMDIPKDYFSKSKTEILKAVAETSEKEPKVIRMNPFMRYAVAASVIALISLGVFFTYNNNDPKPIPSTVTNIDFSTIQENEILINSLLVEDGDMDEFLDAYVVNEIVIKAEVSEKAFDDILIESLFIQDSSLDDYLNNQIIDNIL